MGPVGGPYGTLSPPDSESVGPYGTLSPSNFDSIGPVGPDGTLSTSDLAGILIPAVPVGIPSPVGLVGPVGRLSPFDPGDRPSPFAPPVGDMSSVDPARGGGGGVHSSD